MTTVVDAIDVDAPSFDDPAVLPVAAVVAEPKREKKVKSPKEPKPAKEPKALKEPKVKEPKPTKQPKPEKPPKAVKEPKAAKEPKPAKAPKPPKVPRPPKVRSDVSNRRWSIAAGVVGALGLLFSVVLAIGALFIALDAAQGSAFFAHLSDVCDALVGPLKDVFSFSGVNADKKQALVGWGLGSMGYLLLGRFLQSVFLSRIKD